MIKHLVLVATITNILFLTKYNFYSFFCYFQSRLYISRLICVDFWFCSQCLSLCKNKLAQRFPKLNRAGKGPKVRKRLKNFRNACILIYEMYFALYADLNVYMRNWATNKKKHIESRRGIFTHLCRQLCVLYTPRLN